MTMTAQTPVKPAIKLAKADPGIYPWEITEGRYAGRIGVFVPSTYMGRVEEIPGARYSKADEVWTLPKAMPAVLSLGEMKRAMKLPLVPEPKLMEWVREQTTQWGELRDLALTIRTTATKGPDDVFYPHQDDDAAWLAYGGGRFPIAGRLLLSETGIGKTAGVIAGMLKLGLPDDKPILIAAPRRTLRKAWADDLEKFLPGVEVEVIRGTVTQRRKSLDRIKAGEVKIGVIGWESLKAHTRFAPNPGHALKRCPDCGGPKLAVDTMTEAEIKALPEDQQPIAPSKCQAHAKELNEIDWGLIVADEVHRAMNSTSQLTQALWGLVKSAPDAMRWGLTGTPVSKKVEQSWTLLHYADAEAWPVKSVWIDYYARQGYNMAGYYETDGLRPEREAEFQQTFQGVTRRVLKAQVLDLPPLLMGGGLIREVEMPTEQAKAYRQMRDEMVAFVKEGKITAQNVLVAAGRLTLMAQATGYPEEGPTPTEAQDDIPVKMLLRMPSGKVSEVVADMVSGEFDGHQVAVSMESRRLLRLLEGEMHRAGISQDDIGIIAGDVNDAASEYDIDQFQAGKKKWMLYTYAAGGTGLTLTAASYLLRVQRSWSPILSKQGLDRVHRIGSEKHAAISVIDYVSTGTIEERQMKVALKDADLLEQIVQDKAKLADLFAGS